MHQRPYIQSLLERYRLSEAKSSSTPADINVKLVKDDGAAKLADPVCYQSIVGSLLYAAIATRPDIAQAVGAVSKFNSCPTETHITGVKRILRYLKGTINLGLKFEKKADNSIIGFSDADWAGDLDNRHSTSGNLFVMSGGAIRWLSKKQPVVTLSTTEAEYVALGAATQEVVWLRRLLLDIKASPKIPTVCRSHTCQHCGAEVSQFATHGLSCRKCAGWYHHHSAVNDIIHRALAAVHVPSRLEPSGLYRSDGKRPDGVSIVPWKCGPTSSVGCNVSRYFCTILLYNCCTASWSSCSTG